MLSIFVNPLKLIFLGFKSRFKKTKKTKLRNIFFLVRFGTRSYRTVIFLKG